MQPLLVLGVISIYAVCCSELISGALEDISVQNNISNTTFYPPTCKESIIRRTGVHLVHPQPGFGEPIRVFCDHDYDGGGWTVIQNRFNGSLLFYQDWKTYEDGFGNMDGEFWLGLKRIYELTNSNEHELIVLIEDRQKGPAFARYTHFRIANPSAGYEILRLGSFSGTAGDSLTPHLGRKFSTFDNENDSHVSRNCAQWLRSGWWYHDCHQSDLNGLYWNTENKLGMNWHSYTTATLSRSRMMIRAVSQPDKK